jgi:pimeloyl-ACP methyl ester carboxylesterase
MMTTLRTGRRDKQTLRNCGRAIVAVLLLALIAGCSPPVSITQMTPAESVTQFNRTALTDESPSEATLITLRRHDLVDSWRKDPKATLRILHAEVAGHPDLWSDLFALAELSYLQARRDNSPAEYLAATIYAFAFLFPSSGQEAPNPFDPRFRQACDIYNVALVEALPRTGTDLVQLKTGLRELPFGSIDIAFHPMESDSDITYQPTGSMKVNGLANIYRTPGLGASLAASTATSASNPAIGLTVAPAFKVPANALLLIPTPREQLARSILHGELVVHTIFDADRIRIGKQSIPLEYDQTAARSLGLVETVTWSRNIQGFLTGSAYENGPRRLVALEPHRPGRIPVIFVHGTASSPFRWADMVNDLLQDRRITDHFEFWFFSYASGNPIPYSALLLRDSLDAAVEQLGGIQADPALGHMVIIGHSQGGLLSKMLVIDPGSRLWDSVSRVPLDDLKMDSISRDLIRRAFFIQRSKEIDRVIFIATPHQGSYVAATAVPQMLGRLVSFPGGVAKAGAELLSGNADRLKVAPRSIRLGSVYGMAPGSMFTSTLSSEPIAPGVRVNSIIPVGTSKSLQDADDGVVSYRSAHLPDAESELVVESDHSAQITAVTDEIRRILLLQLASFCVHGSCAGPTVAQAAR